ncbi:hypothetical protein HN51_070879 [Arachis hypogaea]|uniref:zinc finger protein CONSTANS-LIKE 6 n=1 Tax=Arachis hypogaea TaxID=3818 RepID=UPI000DEC63EB|nr:zinc finger protein CONSTANS-LIKE 16 [Arachis hypogaea]
MKGSSSGALGAKTARACDSCLRVRARWFCAADDAFLCHGCDNLVHSANQLASRHERVRLQTSSSSAKIITTAWHSGFTRKARTPRHHNKSTFLMQQQQDAEKEEEAVFNNYHGSVFLDPVVPDLGSEDIYESEEQILCRVPVFHPFDDDSVLCSVHNNEVVEDEMMKKKKKKMKKMNNDDGEEGEGEVPCTFGLENFSDLADVENLLHIEDDSTMIKVKDELQQVTNDDDDCNLESILDWNIDTSDQSMMMAVVEHDQEEEENINKVEIIKKEKFLRLNYEEVISAWASQGSPWTTGNPPKFNFDDCWPHYMGSSGGVDNNVEWCHGEEVRNMRWHQIGGVDDGGREARVSRYREKRRTRLFAKKIRYEVRKLNAEKRPRMKGRFVKRTSSSSSSFVEGAITTT